MRAAFDTIVDLSVPDADEACGPEPDDVTGPDGPPASCLVTSQWLATQTEAVAAERADILGTAHVPADRLFAPRARPVEVDAAVLLGLVEKLASRVGDMATQRAEALAVGHALADQRDRLVDAVLAVALRDDARPVRLALLDALSAADPPRPAVRGRLAASHPPLDPDAWSP